jgi:hypothetical protein
MQKAPLKIDALAAGMRIAAQARKRRTCQTRHSALQQNGLTTNRLIHFSRLKPPHAQKTECCENAPARHIMSHTQRETLVYNGCLFRTF